MNLPRVMIPMDLRVIFTSESDTANEVRFFQQRGINFVSIDQLGSYCWRSQFSSLVILHSPWGLHWQAKVMAIIEMWIHIR